jgi:hypothetical protein
VTVLRRSPGLLVGGRAGLPAGGDRPHEFLEFQWADERRAHGMPHPDELRHRGFEPVARHPRFPTSLLMRRATSEPHRKD